MMNAFNFFLILLKELEILFYIWKLTTAKLDTDALTVGAENVPDWTIDVLSCKPK